MKSFIAVSFLALISTASFANTEDCTFSVLKNNETIISRSSINTTKSYIWGTDDKSESYLNKQGFQIANPDDADFKIYMRYDYDRVPFIGRVDYIDNKVLTMTVYRNEKIVMRRTESGPLLNNGSYKKLLKQINKEELSCNN